MTAKKNNDVLNDEVANFTADNIAKATDTAQLPPPTEPPIAHATYKTSAEDFVVNEILPLEFTGEGEHLWLHIQKKGMNTAYLAKLLSEWAEIPLRDVGYSGLKDRHALTTQWFSLRLPKKQPPTTEFLPTYMSDDETIHILDQHWHNKKLGRGAHRANEFIITLRDVKFASESEATVQKNQLEQHLTAISQSGVPNYFGSQRFGHYGNNINEALALFARPLQKKSQSQGKKAKRKRAPQEQHSMALSAARSLIFNEILSARVRDGSWNTGVDGEVFNLDGSGSIFSSDVLDDELRERVASGDIHPTAVLWGIGNDKVSGAAADIENEVVQQPLLTALANGLERHEVKAQRRALRLPIEDLAWEWQEDDALILRFTLTPGSFATSVLANIVKDLQLPVERL